MVCHAETHWRTLNCRSSSQCVSRPFQGFDKATSSATYGKPWESFDTDKPKNILQVCAFKLNNQNYQRFFCLPFTPFLLKHQVDIDPWLLDMCWLHFFPFLISLVLKSGFCFCWWQRWYNERTQLSHAEPVSFDFKM